MTVYLPGSSARALADARAFPMAISVDGFGVELADVVHIGVGVAGTQAIGSANGNREINACRPVVPEIPFAVADGRETRSIFHVPGCRQILLPAGINAVEGRAGPEIRGRF